jgi:hypothetical protein
MRAGGYWLISCQRDIACISDQRAILYLVIARGRIRIQRMRRGELRSQSRNLAAVSLDVLGQRRLGGGGALLRRSMSAKAENDGLKY